MLGQVLGCKQCDPDTKGLLPMPFANPQYLVETSWLQQHLADPGLRVLDCTVYLRPIEGGVRPESGRATWEQGHIPGSGFADLLSDLSDSNTPLPVMMPPAEQFAAAMSRYGVGDEHRVVLYDAGNNAWAARVWWMLRAFGFERASVLNGGWLKWHSEGRPVSIEPSAYPSAHFTARPAAGRIVGKHEVHAAMGEAGTRLVNALSEEEFAGTVARVARPGHIPGSSNVPAGSLIDPATNAYLEPSLLQRRFERAGAMNRARVITYCGGGIAACSDALALTLLGVENVAVYDGSMAEWAADPQMPLETGASAT